MQEPQDNSGEDDMEPIPAAPDTNGADPDLVREELQDGHCSGNLDHGKKAKNANATLQALGAGSSYKSQP